MVSFLLSVHAPSGELLSRGEVRARAVYAALAEANRRDIALTRRHRQGLAPGRIDIADGDGRMVGRVVLRELLAAWG